MPISRPLAAGLLALLAAGCGKPASSDPFAVDGTPSETIECAVSGETAFADACPIERVPGPNGLSLTIRHPDGGFRRLLVTGDGRGVIAADGSEPAAVSIAGDNRIEVSVARDRYRLPATVKGAGPSTR